MRQKMHFFSGRVERACTRPRFPREAALSRSRLALPEKRQARPKYVVNPAESTVHPPKEQRPSLNVVRLQGGAEHPKSVGAGARAVCAGCEDLYLWITNSRDKLLPPRAPIPERPSTRANPVQHRGDCMMTTIQTEAPRVVSRAERR